jgi:hypothetical protein
MISCLHELNIFFDFPSSSECSSTTQFKLCIAERERYTWRPIRNPAKNESNESNQTLTFKHFFEIVLVDTKQAQRERERGEEDRLKYIFQIKKRYHNYRNILAKSPGHCG